MNYPLESFARQETPKSVAMAMKVCLMVVLAVAMFGSAMARPGYDHDYYVSVKEDQLLSKNRNNSLKVLKSVKEFN